MCVHGQLGRLYELHIHVSKCIQCTFSILVVQGINPGFITLSCLPAEFLTFHIVGIVVVFLFVVFVHIHS